MAFAYSVQLNDTDGLPVATENQFVADLNAALAAWSQYIAGSGPVVVSLNIGPHSTLGTADGGATSRRPDHTVGSQTVTIGSGLDVLLNGNPSGQSSITIDVDPSYVSKMLSSSPVGDFGIAVFEHELEHGFGMTGYRTVFGSLFGSNESFYDTFVTFIGGGVFFTGPNAEAVYGGPVPLTNLPLSVTNTNYVENIYHLGNSVDDPVVGRDLMSGIWGGYAPISDLDVAILQDIGVPVTRLVDQPATWHASFRGPDGSLQFVTYADGRDAKTAQALLSTENGNDVQLVTSPGLATTGDKQITVVRGAATTLFGGARFGQAVVADDTPLVFSAAGSGSLAAGDGGELLFITDGTGPWTVSTGAGGDTILAATGSDSIAAGGGANLIFLGSGASTVASQGVDTVVGGSGLAFVSVTGAGALAFAGDGGMVALPSSGFSTITGLSNRLVIPGGNGAGLFFGGALGHNAITTSGGASTVIGGGDGDVLTAAGSSGDVIAAGSGAETITGAGSTGGNAFFAGTGDDAIIGGAGATAMQAGTGNATLTAGSGPNLFVFINGGGGGADVVLGFDQGRDRVILRGFASSAIDDALARATVSGGATHIVLADGTSVGFGGITSLQRSDFV